MLSTEDPGDRPALLSVSPQGAEALLERDGDFLVRDSSSGPGDYVLSCYWRDEPMHFKIIRVVLRPKKVFISVSVLLSNYLSYAYIMSLNIV